MKKLLMILGDFSIGGGQNMVYELSREIDKEKYDVHILCYHGHANTSIEAKAEKIAKVKYLDVVGRITPNSIKKVFAAINEINPDIVHAHLGSMVFAIPWAFLHPRKSLMITAHTRADKAFNKKVEWIFRYMLKRRANKTMVVAVSEENHRGLLDYFGIKDDVCRFVNNGIDINRFYTKEHNEYTLINVARHDENKNQAALIRSFARLHNEHPKTRLFLLGDGETHQVLINQVNEMDLVDSVVFTGNVSNAEEYYAESDLYVQTSHREALPLSVLEAMAAGLPIVSTNVGGLCDVVKQNGILVDDNDEEALYDAIVRIYKQNDEQRNQMSAVSRALVQNYSSERMARQYEKLYEEIT